jgi:hypothetical protein
MSGLMCTRRRLWSRWPRIGLRGEVREYGRIANMPAAVARLARQLSHNGVRLRFCYEAGPCGYGIQRQLSGLEHECVVVAPSLIPKRAGDRIKTDRRDAASLARLDRDRRVDGGMGAGCRARGDARSGSCPTCPGAGPCAGPASSSPASCCANVAIAGGRPGPSCTSECI